VGAHRLIIDVKVIGDLSHGFPVAQAIQHIEFAAGEQSVKIVVHMRPWEENGMRSWARHVCIFDEFTDLCVCVN